MSEKILVGVMAMVGKRKAKQRKAKKSKEKQTARQERLKEKKKILQVLSEKSTELKRAYEDLIKKR